MTLRLRRLVLVLVAAVAALAGTVSVPSAFSSVTKTPP